MGLWSRLTGKFRIRGVLSRDVPDDADAAEQMKLLRPKPTATGRVPERPQDTPSMKPRDAGGTTAGTRSYDPQGGTPSTRRLHNPTHIR
jgi:hypothetical protein